MNEREYTCTLDRSALKERNESWSNLFSKRLGRQAIDQGFAYRFTNDMKGEVWKLIALEAKCCSFLEFKLTLALDPKEKDSFWLEITTPEGAPHLETGIPLK